MPPPIGGVTIHVRRLLDHLANDGVNHTFEKISKASIPKVLLRIAIHRKFHLHTSNIYLMFLLTSWGRLCFRTPIITLHSDFARFSGVRGTLLKYSIKLAKYPIVLNNDSFKNAKQLNTSTQKIPAFINPLRIKNLSLNDLSILDSLKSGYKTVFYSSAYNVSINAKGEEVYGISHLVKLFVPRPESALIISDPSGNYSNFLNELRISIPKNVKLISHPHDSIPILTNTDCYIRATTTDGDSLSVKEALYYGIPVLASDCVSRAIEVQLFKSGDFNDLGQKIDQFCLNKHKIEPLLGLSGYPALRNLYEI